MNISRSWHAGKPIKKPDYDPDAVTEELVQAVVDCYLIRDEDERHPALSKIVELLSNYHLNPMKVRRILITAEEYTGRKVYEGTAKCELRVEQIRRLRQASYNLSKIASLLSISEDAVLSYSPYSKIIYKMDTLPNGERSVNAGRQEVYRKRKRACEKLMEEVNGENLWEAVCDALWECIVAFENYPFETPPSLPFRYSFKLNHHGEKGNEIVVSRKSKTITRSSVEMALEAVIKAGELPVRMSTPKELGVFGASYIYPLFIRFGLVEHVGSHSRGGPRKGSRRKAVDNDGGKRTQNK